MKREELLKQIANMSVMDVVKLTKEMEEKFDVSGDVVAIPAIQEVAEIVEEAQDEFTVMLTSYGEKRVEVVKAVRVHTGLGLKESLELVKSVPVQVGDIMARTAADELKRLLELAGGTVDIK